MPKARDWRGVTATKFDEARLEEPREESRTLMGKTSVDFLGQRRAEKILDAVQGGKRGDKELPIRQITIGDREN